MFKHVEFLKHGSQAKQVIEKENSFILNIAEFKGAFVNSGINPEQE